MIKIIIILLTLLSLTSCIELLDDVTIHSNGTGTFKYSINLSSSKTKVKSILALDTIDGRKVPDINELEKKIIQFKTELSKQKGISNVSITYSFTEYIFKLSLDFDNVICLQNAIQNSIEKVTGNQLTNNTNWLVWNENKLSRNIPQVVNYGFDNPTWLDKNLLETGSYTSISRFDKPVTSFTSIYSKLSKNRLAVMTQVKTNDLLIDSQILKNNISLEGNK